MATIPVMQTTSVSHNSRGGVGMFSKFGKMTTYFHSCFTPRREILKHTPAESFEQVCCLTDPARKRRSCSTPNYFTKPPWSRRIPRARPQPV